MSDGSEHLTFIVRLRLDEGGDTTVVVERVGSGEKVRLHDTAAIGPAIAGMIGAREPGSSRLPDE